MLFNFNIGGVNMNQKQFEPIFSKQISGLPIGNPKRRTPLKKILEEVGVTSY
tara:strand:- start:546 stop:701 length:156 start_codon:yes stop_codon:yes gene_type:complete